MDIVVFLADDGTAEATLPTAAALARVWRNSTLSGLVCVLSTTDREPQMRDALADVPREVVFRKLKMGDIGSSVRAALSGGLDQSSLPSSFAIAIAATGVEIVEPFTSYLRILRERSEVIAVTGLHSPEHVAWARGPGFLLKHRERPGLLVARSNDLCPLLGGFCGTHADLQHRILQQELPRQEPRVGALAVIPGGARVYQPGVGTAGGKLGSYSAGVLRRLREELEPVKRLQEYEASPWFPVLVSGSPRPGDRETAVEEAPQTDLVVQGRQRPRPALPGVDAASSQLWFQPTSALRQSVCEVLQQDRSLRRRLTYYPNQSISEIAGELRYQATGSVPSELNWYRLANSEELQLALASARRGLTESELVEALSRRYPDSQPEAIESYVGELIDQEVLLPELWAAKSVQVEPGERFDGIASGVGAWLETVSGSDADSSPLLVPGEAQLLAPQLAPLLASTRSIELFKRASSAEAALDPEVIETIRRGGDILCALGSTTPEQQTLQRFFERFLDLYGRRWVPLAEAFQALGFNVDRSPVSTRERRRQRFLLPYLERLWKQSEFELALTREDFLSWRSPEDLTLAPCVEVEASLVATSDSAMARGEHRIVVRSLHTRPQEFVSIPSDGNLAGSKGCNREWRDLDVGLPRLDFGPRNGTEAIDNRTVPSALISSGTGNSWERLPSTDLLLGAEHGFLLLRCSRLDYAFLPRPFKLPRSSPARSTTLVDLLASLALQGRLERAEWDWGAFADATFLPRVTVDSVTLAPARWCLNSGELERLRAAGTGSQLAVMREIRQDRRLPRFVTVGGGDLFDLDLREEVERFCATMAGREGIAVEEVFWNARSIPDAPRNLVQLRLSIPFRRAAAARAGRARSTPKVSSRAIATAPSIRVSTLLPPRINLLFAGAHCGSGYLQRRPRFVELIAAEARRWGLVFRHLRSPVEGARLLANVARGQVRIDVMINYLPVDSAFRGIETPLAEAIRDRGGLLLNDPSYRSLNTKANLHSRLARAGLTLPKTMIWRSWQAARELPADRVANLGSRLVCKPSRGGGGRGVLLDFQVSRETLEEARSFDETDDYLIQELIEPATIDGRKGWFRIYYCLGTSFPVFWSPEEGDGIRTARRVEIDSVRMEPVSSDRLQALGLTRIVEVVNTIARTSGAGWFSCEIAATGRAGDHTFLPIDYLNDACYARTQSEVGAKGLPDAIALEIAKHLVAAVAGRIKSS